MNLEILNKKIKFFIFSVYIVIFFDIAIFLSIFIRNIIYFSMGMLLAPLLQLIPLIIMLIIVIMGLKFITHFWKLYKKSTSDYKYLYALHNLSISNKKFYKIEIVIIFISCSLLALIGGIGIAPLVFIIKGNNSYRYYSKNID
ncbi:hypothetical protein SLITO_v1c10150 [Spiroplasma litorale]|uniref:Uncharacterized protein n=1 Tax=Spiroplasma litorale TaxID=216942 RepID=A0A0K1W364_9MOLU|nr:hypothetical protein [Spiroplasma litorale]AKX34626.1 hypothetical protein SLITO_v1c10150 [Spiroplasma litorale]